MLFREKSRSAPSLFREESRSAPSRGLETWSVNFGKRTYQKQLPAGAMDAQVRAAFADEYQQARSEAGRAAVLRPTLPDQPKKAKPANKPQQRRTPNGAPSGATHPKYGLRQQIGGSNQWGKFDVDVAPLGLQEMRQRHPEIKQLEQWAWDASQDPDDFWVDGKFPFLHHEVRPPREHGFVAFESLKDGSFSYQRLGPELDPRADNWNMIKKPPNADSKWRITKPGHRTMIVEHVHGIPYQRNWPWEDKVVRGPSEHDFGTAYSNPDAYSVVQAVPSPGERQYFYFGPRLYPPKAR